MRRDLSGTYVMAIIPMLAKEGFGLDQTRAICDAFDGAWAMLQGVGSPLAEPIIALSSRTILARRIIEMAQRGVTDVIELRDDALAYLEGNPPETKPDAAHQPGRRYSALGAP